MSEESHRGMRELPPPPPPPPPASHPPIQHIPHQDRTFGYYQTNIHHQHHYLTASPLNTGDNFGSRESFPPPPPPHNIPTPPPPHLPNPPPMFTRPPPRFLQPPPAIPNIPFQPAFRNPLIATPLECSTMWHQHSLPPAPQCHQMQGHRAEGVLYKDTVGQKEEQDAKWMKEFEKNIMSCPPPPSPPPPNTESITTKTKNSVKVITHDCIDACVCLPSFYVWLVKD